MVQKVTAHLMSIRVGSIFLMCSFALFGPSAPASQSRPPHRAPPRLLLCPLVFTSCGTMIALLVSFCWALMVFRPTEYNPDWCSSLPTSLFSGGVFGALLRGWCVMMPTDPHGQTRQRTFSALDRLWNIWAAMLFTPGQLILFFKDGPFSWHGILALYLPSWRSFCGSYHVIAVLQAATRRP